MARRKTSKKKASGWSLLLVLGLIVAGFIWPEFGGVVNALLGENIFPEGATEITENTPPYEYDDVAAANLPNTPSSFVLAKRLLYSRVYEDQRVSFYCGCDYSPGHHVDLNSCRMSQLEGIERAKRIEAEHVFPAYHFGQHRQCWREPMCTDRDGDTFKGRDCCEEIDPVFRAAHNDLHNLVPAVGEINGDRSNLNWGMVEGEAREYGACNFEVDRSIRRAEPPEQVMGDVARIYFYMSDTYGIRLSDQDRQLLEAWNRMDPVDDWERTRDERIAAIQGNHNPYVQ